MRRKSFLVGASLAFVATALATSTANAQTLKTTFVAGGFTKALYVTSEPTNSSRLYVVQQQGQIKLIKNGVTQATPFLDLTSIVFSSGNEQGLLGMAFHPNYASNGRFFVDYVDLNQQEVIRQYHVSANPDVADPASFTTIFGPQIDPQSNHNGGNLQFGPDGYLYYGLGDGGAGNDTGAGHDVNTGNGQSLNTYMGKLLRFDVENPPTYVPASNPFAASAFPLIWAYGLRNPWRWSFDRLTGDMYIGDVGQDAWEEVDFQPASSTGGENYGWRCMEATHCTGLTGCTCNAPNLKLPIWEYGHVAGQCSITGGYVYRGSAFPSLQGTYFFADYCAGRIWTFKYAGGQVTQFTDRTAEMAPGGGHAIQNPDSFGQDADGELYIVDQNGGEIYKIGEVCPVPTTYCTAAPNSAGPGAFMSFSGDGTISQNNLQLACSGCPTGINGLFFYGQGQTMGTLGNGVLCVASHLHRLPVVQTGIFGDASFPFDVHAPPAVVTAGSTWNFQFWYRDPAGGGALYNASNGLSVVFCP
jgi:glucose/arabinose dehydrogenase